MKLKLNMNETKTVHMLSNIRTLIKLKFIKTEYRDVNAVCCAI